MVPCYMVVEFAITNEWIYMHILGGDALVLVAGEMNGEYRLSSTTAQIHSAEGMP